MECKFAIKCKIFIKILFAGLPFSKEVMLESSSSSSEGSNLSALVGAVSYGDVLNSNKKQTKIIEINMQCPCCFFLKSKYVNEYTIVPNCSTFLILFPAWVSVSCTVSLHLSR